MNDNATNITGTVARPSRPSVRFTALEAPTIINTEKGRQKALNIRNNKNISLVIFKPDSMYISWEIRGFVKEIVDDVSANQQIDKVSMRYTGHPYARDNNTSWKDAKIKDREMWIINIEKMVAMNRPAAKIVQSEVE